MNLRAAFAFLGYWVVIGIIFSFGSGYLGGASTSINTPDTSLVTGNFSNSSTGYTAGVTEQSGSVWDAIKTLIKVGAFVFIGVGLPTDTPGWFAVAFAILQTGITILAVLVVTDAIHSG